LKSFRVVCVLLFAALPATAHHATVTNFTQELITVEGVIEQIRFQNPHSSILIRHTSADDKEIFWLIETGAKTTLQRKGVSLDSLQVGAKIQATGLKGRREYTMFLQEIVFEDGSIFNTEGLTE
jgi:hypothetical protein